MPDRKTLKKFQPINLNCDHEKQFKNMSYAKYLNTAHWSGLKKCVIDRDQQCMCCNSTTNLTVHHKTYRGRGREIEADLVCLCSKCHSLVHKYYSTLTVHQKYSKQKAKRPLSDFERARYAKNQEIMERYAVWRYRNP